MMGNDAKKLFGFRDQTYIQYGCLLSTRNGIERDLIPTRTAQIPVMLSQPVRLIRVTHRLCNWDEIQMGRGILLWLLGVPIPIIIILALIWH